MPATDTIVALATPPGRSALALIRLSGPQALELAATLAAPRPLPPRRAVHAVLKLDGKMLDDAVVTCWPGPGSYTGEDTAEICCHGNPLIVESLMEACCRLGARVARGGEFTERAFLNGRMDLTQAEAVMDLIQAGSERALRAARALQDGHLGKSVRAMVEELLQLLAHLEAHIDFPEEDIDPQTGAAFLQGIDNLSAHLESLLETAPEGRHLREGFQVVLCGAPNAGKSSLLNALLQRDRAIVSPVPGTTRDTIEETITLGGMCVRLVDTAGLRPDADAVEQLGIARTHEALAAADLVLHLVDPLDPQPQPQTQLLEDTGSAPVLHLRSKCDLHPGPLPEEWLAVSAKTGHGLDALRQRIASHLRMDETSGGLDALAINSRHEALLARARDALLAAREGQSTGRPPELVSSDLRLALQSLSEITGRVTNEHILDRLFKNFCIGK
ncbi:MAG: tRNA uridine-5-carboxymethylaminomethyl(34) synthesis GTPase MnmE [Candidatus Methylacidiphilales bacterium]|nr:tRNA uridine-5-carboxymethylaminomethyl(34) synthesis GTPase MnmE [Candidatus Methylacidiphilales bacterium]